MKKKQHLFLIDGSGYIFRAYYALPALKRKSDQLPIGAVSGFCNMIWKLLCNLHDQKKENIPTHLAVIFDYSSKTFRKEIFPDYKATRKAPPEDLIPQFSFIREATRAFGLPCIEIEGYEADDIIATYAKQAQEKGIKVTIISSDKDLMQLVNENVSLYDSVKNIRITPDQVKEKWGVFPEKMQDLQSLTGDSSDNIPGIPGIGPKTAAKLLEEFGSLDNLLENVDKITKVKCQEAIKQGRETIFLAKKLVSLKKDVPVDETIEDFSLNFNSGLELASFLKKMELNALLQKVIRYFNLNTIKEEEQLKDTEKIQSFDNQNALSYDTKTLFEKESYLKIKYQKFFQDQKIPYIILDTEDLLKEWIEKIKFQGFFSYFLDISLQKKEKKFLGISIALSDKESAYIPLIFKEESLFRTDLEVEKAICAKIFWKYFLVLLKDDAIRKVGYNIKENWILFASAFSIPTDKIFFTSYEDILLLSYNLHNGKHNHDLETLAYYYFDYDLKKDSIPELEKKIDSYSKRDLIDRALLLLFLFDLFQVLLIKNKLAYIYKYLDLPLIPVLLEMEQKGVLIDVEILKNLSSSFKERALKLEKDIYKIAGVEFNLASPKQTAEILFKSLNLESKKKTKTKQMSTSSDVLEELALENHEIAQKILDWRQITKLITTYAEALPKFVDKNNRIHTNYNLTKTMTGRLASSSPNLQNIPIRLSEGKKIRSAIISAPNYSLVSLDYSQIELRLLAYIASIYPLQEAFSKKQDIHALTASRLLKVPIDDVTSDLRRYAKIINYGIIYGMSAFGLAKQLKIPKNEAQGYIKSYLGTMPGIQNYIEKTKKMAREKGFVETIFKRKIFYPDINSQKPMLRAFSERAAINAPLQGSAADIIRKAMINISEYIKEKKLQNEVKMIIQVHDELVFEIKDEMLDEIPFVLKKFMEKVSDPSIVIEPGLEVDIKIGKNWKK